MNNPPKVPPVLQENKFRRKQRARVERFGESVYWLLEPDGLESLVFLSKSSGSLFYLDLERRDWVTAYNETALTHIEQRGNPWPRPANCRALIEAEVELSCRADKFPEQVEGAYERLNYGFTEL